MARRCAITLLGFALLAVCGRPLGPGAQSGPPPTWTVLAPGMELATFGLPPSRDSDDTRLVVVRVDPCEWEFRFLCVGAPSGRPAASAREWAEREGLAAAINAGMYATDGTTHIGYLRCDGHTCNAAGNRYQSVAAFAPHSAEHPAFRIFDLDAEPPERLALDEIRERYACLAQNLRLIKRPGENRWSSQARAWSEAALGEDACGRALLIFCRAPLEMHEFNRLLLSLPIDLVAAQHLEGGPEAQLYLRVGDFEAEWVGSSASGLLPSDAKQMAWPIPNVLGVVRRTG